MFDSKLVQSHKRILSDLERATAVIRANKDLMTVEKRMEKLAHTPHSLDETLPSHVELDFNQFTQIWSVNLYYDDDVVMGRGVTADQALRQVEKEVGSGN